MLDDPEKSLEIALEAEPKQNDRPRTPEADAALSRAMELVFEAKLVGFVEHEYMWGALNSSGQVVTASADNISLFDAETGVPINQVYRYSSIAMIKFGRIRQPNYRENTSSALTALGRLLIQTTRRGLDYGMQILET